MAVRDHDPISLTSFLGTFDRGEDESVPPGFFKGSQNIRFKDGVKTREGTSLSVTISTVRRIVIYKRIGEVDRLLILRTDGNLYDSTNLGSPILSIASMTDFSAVSLYNRAYITPHNGLKGLPGESVYVYEGSGVARFAAGAGPPASPALVITEGAVGYGDPGIHLFGVAYETSSGHVTQVGSFVARFSGLGGFSYDISSIPLGPAGTTARVLVATKDVRRVDPPDTWDEDYQNKTWYFIPGGRIPNNSATTYNVAFFDADLQSEASFLFDQLATIPAAVGIGIYRGHLITWGEDLNDSIVRVSPVGLPESFDSEEGFATINPGDSGGGIKYCAEYRSQLLCFKTQRTYVTADNDNAAAFWVVNALDKSVGTECHGVGKILDFGEDVRDRMFVADRSGLQLFVGTFSDTEITYNLSDIWSRINKAHFHKIEVAVDPLQALVYIAVPLDAATENSHLIVGDWQEGLSADAMRFTLWSFPVAPQTIVVDVNSTTKESQLKFGALAGNIYVADDSLLLDFGNAIDSWVEFPLYPQEDDYPIYHFAGVRLRVKGSGILQITLSGLDSVQTATIPSLTLSASPGRPLFRGFNFTSERCSVKLRTSLSSEWFNMTHFSLFYKKLWETRPEE